MSSRAARRCGPIVCLVLLMLSVGCGGEAASRPAPDPWPDVKPGWTELPAAPTLRTEASPLWTGSELLVWGGCLDRIGECIPTDEGYAFDPSTGTWRELPPARRPGASAKAVWTGREAIFLDFGPFREAPRVTGQAYDPDTRTWRTLPPTPIPPASRGETRDGTQVWTGSRLIVWGGGAPRGPGPRAGAAYDPATNTWRRIADAPIGLNLASGVWTGDEMLVFGSLLDGRNYATTRSSIGAAYDPATDQWRRLPPSRLSPQATSAVMAGRRMLAWDYEQRAQEYDPDRDRWDQPKPVGLDFSECYPQSAVLPGHVLGICRQATLYDIATASWERIEGGPLVDRVRLGHRQGLRYPWDPVSVTSAGPVAVLMLWRTCGIGVNCQGRPGSPLSLWAYRP
jgi:hypothetical protein